MTSRPNPYRSARLIYRAPESPQDDDFFFKMKSSPLDAIGANASLAKPPSRQDVKKYQEYITEKALLGVVICLPPPDQDSADPKATATDPKAIATDPTVTATDPKPTAPGPTPIGIVHLPRPQPDFVQHRETTIGIGILTDYQGRGYGGEAINWILEWAFVMAGMHRVSIECFEHNEGAFRLYQRLGFKVEGRRREIWWQYGRFWDHLELGMLEDEWRAMREKEKIGVVVALPVGP